MKLVKQNMKLVKENMKLVTTDRHYLYTVLSKCSPPPARHMGLLRPCVQFTHSAIYRTAKIFYFLAYRQTDLVELRILNSLGGYLDKLDVISTELVSRSCQHVPQNNSLESRFFWYVTPFSLVRSCNIHIECTDYSFKVEEKLRHWFFPER